MKVYLLDTMTASALWDEGDADHEGVLENAQRAATSGDVMSEDVKSRCSSRSFTTRILLGAGELQRTCQPDRHVN